MIRVLLVDDQALVRAGFRLILQAEDDITVVGEAGDGAQAIAMIREASPDVVLLDVRMPHMDGLTATPEILKEPDPPRILMLTTFDDDEYVTDALLAGASGYLLKDVEPDDLVSAIRSVSGGDLQLAPALTRRLVEHYLSRSAAPAPDPRLGRLSPREREVLSALGRGLSNAEIVAELHLSLSTVKTHVASILAKLDLRDRVQAALVAQAAELDPTGRG